MTYDKNIASLIDHTLLSPVCTESHIIELCKEANTYSFFSVCVPPCFIQTAQSHLNETVKIATVVGFPTGYSCLSTKAYECEQATKEGCHEIDMVAPLRAIKVNNKNVFSEELKTLGSICGLKNLKVILEISFLTSEEIQWACEIAKEVQVGFVKTSTGFSESGATLEAVELMRKTVGQEVGVKASGGIRDKATAKTFIQAGANRLGTSASVAIVTQ